MGFHSGQPAAPGGEVIGTAGGGLNDAAWAKSAGHARSGQLAELATGKVLDDFAGRHPVAVLHDLDLPLRGYTANIDHLVVSGAGLLLVDSKSWAPGFVWSLGGRGYRGLRPFAAATKRTLPMAVDALTAYLVARNVAVPAMSALLVVWPSRRDGGLSLWALRPPGAVVVTGQRFAANPGRSMGTRAPDPVLVSALTPLVRR